MIHFSLIFSTSIVSKLVVFIFDFFKKLKCITTSDYNLISPVDSQFGLSYRAFNFHW